MLKAFSFFFIRTLHFIRRSYHSNELGLEEVVEEDFDQILEISMVT